MKKYLTVLASFIIMLCIGSIYAWSVIASELIEKYNFTTSQSQVIFGTLIGIFPATMIFVGRLERKINYNFLGYFAGLLFFIGYYIASISNGSFTAILTGIGVLGGIATGLGYWVALTSPVQWFPEKKGLITGIAAAGFGLGAVFMSEITELLLSNGKEVLQILQIFGISYGLIILIFSSFIHKNQNVLNRNEEPFRTTNLIGLKIFKKLILGIFLGTFAGLLIIGSLKMIGGQNDISNHYLILGVALFAVANFLGRLVWGFLSDKIGASLGIFLALLFQAISIISLDVFNLNQNSFIILASLIGFGFGGNFVLFAKETAQVFGVNNLGIVYPYVFIGYAIAGITGPLSGGLLYDYSGSFFLSILFAGIMSLAGSLLFLRHYLSSSKKISKLSNIEIAARYIQEGKLVAFPTETVYGLGANALNAIAVAKIFALKERPSFDPLIIHIASFDDLKILTSQPNDLVLKLAKKFWPGPLTIVLPKSSLVPDIVTSGLPTVGIRMPDNEIALNLIRTSKCLIAAPSANKFGNLSPVSANHVRKQLPGVDYILDGGKTTIGIESTIVSIDGNICTLLRPGKITIDNINDALPGVFVFNIQKTEKLIAPGLFKSHYSPTKPLYFFKDGQIDLPKKSGLILHSGRGKILNGEKVIYTSQNNNLLEIAANLFSSLHAMEDDEQINQIFIERVVENGLGIAIMDRLKKAVYRYESLN